MGWDKAGTEDNSVVEFSPNGYFFSIVPMTFLSDIALPSFWYLFNGSRRKSFLR